MNKREIRAELIAPCGGNCAVCMGYLRENGCPGCRGDDENKPYNCVRCRIKNCDELTANNFMYCYECRKFPCKRIQQLDLRYRTNYDFSMIDNLNFIKEHGIDAFITQEKERWTCSDCGGMMCVHRGYCTECGKVKFNHSGTKRARIK